MAEQFPSYLLQEVNENLRGFAYKLHKTQIGNLIRFKMDESIYNETEDKIFLLNIPFFSDQEIYNENISSCILGNSPNDNICFFLPIYEQHFIQYLGR